MAPRAATALFAALLVRTATGAPPLTPVFVAGVGGYACYRIPAMLALPNGTLLAFAEGRRFSCADHGWNDIVQRASHDGGASWGALSVVYGESGATTKNVTIGNPAPAVLSADGASILMPFCRENLEVGVARSDDGGTSWRLVARSITVPPGTWTTWVATGPPGSVRLSSGGRIVVPMNFANDTIRAASAALLSDDGGANWRLSAGVVIGGNENQVASLPWRSPAALHMTMRNAGGAMRLSSESADGGETWSAPWPTVAETECEGSIAALPRSQRLAMSSAFAVSRTNMTVHLSRDDGHSWTAAAGIHAGPSAYSSLVDLAAGAGANEAVGLLFEMGAKMAYEQIAFVRVELPAAAAPAPEASVPAAAAAVAAVAAKAAATCTAAAPNTAFATSAAVGYALAADAGACCDACAAAAPTCAAYTFLPATGAAASAATLGRCFLLTRGTGAAPRAGAQSATLDGGAPTSCPFGSAPCASGACALFASWCATAPPSCGVGQTVCPDGTTCVPQAAGWKGCPSLPSYLNTSLPADARAQLLVAELSLDEIAPQLDNQGYGNGPPGPPGIERVAVPHVPSTENPLLSHYRPLTRLPSPHFHFPFPFPPQPPVFNP